MQFEYAWGEDTYEFECAPNYGSKLMVDLILSGVTYPHLKFVDDVRVILDVGANVGAAATFFARSYPDAVVYAFEPGREPFAILAGNASRLANVTTVTSVSMPRTARPSSTTG